MIWIEFLYVIEVAKEFTLKNYISSQAFHNTSTNPYHPTPNGKAAEVVA